MTLDDLHVIDYYDMNGYNVDRVHVGMKFDTMLIVMAATPDDLRHSSFSDSFLKTFIRAARFIGCAV